MLKLGMSWTALLETGLKGFAVSGGLIVALGAQNAFVLRQGLKKDRIFIVALVSAFCDAVLTSIGVNGLGAWLAESPTLTRIACWGGAAFLVYFGVRSLRAAMHPGKLQVSEEGARATTKAIVLQSLGFSLLNPHAILDTVVLLGTIGAQYPPSSRQVFLVGAVSASFVWFFGLGYGAAKLAPLFAKPSAWRVLDTCIGVLMIGIAITLLL
jgi:L-lysine exporter family protein LysE/ArgO